MRRVTLTGKQNVDTAVSKVGKFRRDLKTSVGLGPMTPTQRMGSVRVAELDTCRHLSSRDDTLSHGGNLARSCFLLLELSVAAQVMDCKLSLNEWI